MYIKFLKSLRLQRCSQLIEICFETLIKADDPNYYLDIYKQWWVIHSLSSLDGYETIYPLRKNLQKCKKSSINTYYWPKPQM